MKLLVSNYSVEIIIYLRKFFELERYKLTFFSFLILWLLSTSMKISWWLMGIYQQRWWINKLFIQFSWTNWCVRTHISMGYWRTVNDQVRPSWTSVSGSLPLSCLFYLPLFSFSCYVLCCGGVYKQCVCIALALSFSFLSIKISSLSLELTMAPGVMHLI